MTHVSPSFRFFSAFALLGALALAPRLAFADCEPDEDETCLDQIIVIGSGGSGPPPPWNGAVGPGGGPGSGGHGCAGCTGAGNSGGGWTPTYNDTYTDAHSCNMSPADRQQMAADAVRADVLQEQGARGQVGARRLTLQGYGGSQEQFDIVPGNYGAYGGFALVYGTDFVSLVPGSCQSGSSGT